MEPSSPSNGPLQRDSPTLGSLQSKQLSINSLLQHFSSSDYVAIFSVDLMSGPLAWSSGNWPPMDCPLTPVSNCTASTSYSRRATACNDPTAARSPSTALCNAVSFISWPSGCSLNRAQSVYYISTMSLLLFRHSAKSLEPVCEFCLISSFLGLSAAQSTGSDMCTMWGVVV